MPFKVEPLKTASWTVVPSLTSAVTTTGLLATTLTLKSNTLAVVPEAGVTREFDRVVATAATGVASAAPIIAAARHAADARRARVS